jgi:Cof subfamily protein (haloacid dehalogenase superfamily)
VTYQLLALDLDGTVMGPELIISDAVRQAIAAAQQRGVRVTLATGRMFGASLPFAQLLNVHTPIICYQGAMVRHPITGEIYHHVAMPGELAAEAVRMLLAQDIFVIAYIDEKLCIAERRPELDLYQRFHPEGAHVVVADDLATMVQETPPTKLLFVAQPPVVERELARHGERFSGQLSVVRSHELFGELTALHVSKGAALEALARDLNIAREDVIAIGDQENDLSMISWAGLGLAMGNAIPEVQAAAAAVLPTVHENGVAFAIQRYILEKE